jgi:hypothetical protein
MQQLETIGIILGVIVVGAVLLCIRALWRFIKEHGVEIIFIRLMVGRHTGHHHRQRNTNATFWRDSDGKTYGKVTSRVRKRHHRAGWKNLVWSMAYVVGFVLFLFGLYENWIITLACTGLFFGWRVVVKTVRAYARARNWHVTKGITAPLAAAISSVAELEDADMEKAITLRHNWLEIKQGQLGEIALPDGFHANAGQKEVMQSLVESRFPKPVELKWKTTGTKKGQIVTARIMTAPPLPRMVRFRDHLEDISQCVPGEYIIGYDKDNEPVKLSHNGEKPMKAFSMDSGTGKTTMLGSIAAQCLGNDPHSELVGFDVKRVSLEFLRDIPGATIYSNPKALTEMWDGWYALRNEMDRRYELKQLGKQSIFPRTWIVLEEGNTFAMMMNGLYKNELRQPGMGQNPPIWYDCIAQILWQGREVNMFVIAVVQNFVDRQFGGLSLRSAYGSFGMAGFKPNQWINIIQTRPVPELQTGQGRICIVDPPRQVWVQGLYGTHDELVEYARRNRKPLLKSAG